MFSIRTLTTDLETDTQGLFSYAEFSRIQWRTRRGSDDRELIVEIEPVEVVIDIRPRMNSEDQGGRRLHPKIYTSVVGQYDDLALGCPGVRMPPRN